VNRRRALSLYVGAGAAAVARPVLAQNSTAVRIGCPASGEATAGSFYAQDQGFFAKRGLTASISTGISNAAALGSAMLAGDIDIAIADVVVLVIAHDKGIPFVLLAPGELHSSTVPTFAIAVRDPAMRLGKDFNGKTMATGTTKGIGYLATSAWIDNNGGDSKSVQWREIPLPVEPLALQRGQIDGICAPDPFISDAVAGGAYLVLLDKKPIAPTVLQGAWFSTRDWVAENRGAAKAFAESIREANRWANENPQPAAEILSKYTKMSLPLIQGMKMKGQYQERLDLPTIQPLIDGSSKYGLISKSFPARDMVANL